MDYNQSLLEISRSEIKFGSQGRRSQTFRKTNLKYFKNCYAMCFGNASNLKGEQSWLLNIN